MNSISSLIVLATEGGIPTSNPWSQLALPLGILIFVGTVFMLIRSNLGTRRGYLVMSTSLWGFGFLLSLFWAFGAPGTPPNTGPQNLPGQQLDEYQPVWRGFAEDSVVATEEGSPYTAVTEFPGGPWTDVPADFEDTANTGASNISSFFSGLNDENEAYTDLLTGTETEVTRLYAVADNGRPMLGLTYVTSCQFGLAGAPNDGLPDFCDEVGQPVPADAVDANNNPVATETTVFGYFDAGAPYFPSLLMSGILLVLFALHMVLLARDERRERLEVEQAAAAQAVEVEERATVSV
ncbi:hypothetical protein BH23ACT9_BH23ACT9_21610 [soil metagenome]